MRNYKENTASPGRHTKCKVSTRSVLPYPAHKFKEGSSHFYISFSTWF